MPYTTEQMREYMRAFRAERMAKARAMLGGKCVKCGREDDLHFDHIDRTTKVKPVTRMLHASAEKFFAEVLKCQLLCGDHHREKTKVNREFANNYERQKHHGISRYQCGCRCEICRAAKRQSRWPVAKWQTPLSQKQLPSGVPVRVRAGQP